MAIRNFAQEVYSSDSDQILVPRQKYNFTLILNEADRGNVFFHQIASVTVPGFSMDTAIVNQYNNKRVVQTKMSYDPITVTFYDTYDNKWQNLMNRYIAHYYNGTDGINKFTSLEGDSTINDAFETNKGFTPNATKYFFPEIKIVQNGYRNQYREIILKNPMITGIQGDTLSYSDSSPVMYTATFQPESIQIDQVSDQFDDGL